MLRPQKPNRRSGQNELVQASCSTYLWLRVLAVRVQQNAEEGVEFVVIALLGLLDRILHVRFKNALAGESHHKRARPYASLPSAQFHQYPHLLQLCKHIPERDSS